MYLCNKFSVHHRIMAVCFIYSYCVRTTRPDCYRALEDNHVKLWSTRLNGREDAAVHFTSYEKLVFSIGGSEAEAEFDRDKTWRNL